MFDDARPTVAEAEAGRSDGDSSTSGPARPGPARPNANYPPDLICRTANKLLFFPPTYLSPYAVSSFYLAYGHRHDQSQVVNA